MLINTHTVLITREGTPFKNNGKELTVEDVIGNILTVQPGSDPWRQYKLTNKFSKDEEEVELETNDIVLIKDILVAHSKTKESMYFPYIIGQVIDLLENSKETK